MRGGLPTLQDRLIVKRALAISILLNLGVALGSPASGQSAEIALAADTDVAALGDTFAITLNIDTHGRQLTSAALNVTFDSSVFSLVPHVVTDEGEPRPFQPAAFFMGQVYDNAAHVDDGRAQLSFVTVTGTAVGGERPAVSGVGVLARFKLRVTGYPESGMSTIRLIDSGKGPPTYTELAKPGREARFRVVAGAIDMGLLRQGLIPIPDVEMTAGERWDIELSDHYYSHGDGEIHWSADSSLPEIAEVAIVGGKLGITSRPRRFGTTEIIYSARQDPGTGRGGRFTVTLLPTQVLLGLDRLVIAEDAGATRHRLDAFLVDGMRAEEGWSWEVEGSEFLDVEIVPPYLSLAAPPQWSGEDHFTLTISHGNNLLDALVVQTTVVPVNDAPTIDELAAIMVRVGEQVEGPRLDSFVADVDHAFQSLRVSASGDEFAKPFLLDDRLFVQGHRAGAGSILVEAEDPEGVVATGVIRVTVIAPADLDTLPAVPEEHIRPEETVGSREDDPPDQADDDEPALDEPAVRIEAETSGDAEEGPILPESPESATVPGPPTSDVANTPSSAEVEEEETDGTGVATGDIPSAEASAGLSLADIPAVTIVAGSEASINLDQYVVEGSGVSWTVSEQNRVEAELGDDGRLELRAPASFAGQEFLILTATDSRGQTATELLRVNVRRGSTVAGDADDADPTAPVETESAGGAGSSEPAANTPEEQNLQEFTLLEPEPRRLHVGDVDSVVVLGALVSGPDPALVSWSVRGGVRIGASVDAGSRLILDAREASPGREIFEIEARYEDRSERIRFVVDVTVPASDRSESDADLHAPAPADERVGETTEPAKAEAPPPAAAQPSTGPVSEPPGLEHQPEEASTESGLPSTEPTTTQPVIDDTPPQLYVTAQLAEGASGLEVRITSDEPLAQVSLSRTDGAFSMASIRKSSDGSHEAILAASAISVGEGQAAVTIRVDAADSAGNAADMHVQLAIGRIDVTGGWATSADGLVKLNVPFASDPTLVLIQADSTGRGYWVEFDDSRITTAELVFSVPAASKPVADRSPNLEVGVLRFSAGVWEEVPASYSVQGGELYATVSSGGLFKLGQSSAVEVEIDPQVAYPNPFNDAVVVRYRLAASGRVRIVIFDIRGSVVKTLVNGVRTQGVWTAGWDGTSDDGVAVSSGVYFVQVLGPGSNPGVIKMSLLR